MLRERFLRFAVGISKIVIRKNIIRVVNYFIPRLSAHCRPWSQAQKSTISLRL